MRCAVAVVIHPGVANDVEKMLRLRGTVRQTNPREPMLATEVARDHCTWLQKGESLEKALLGFFTGRAALGGREPQPSGVGLVISGRESRGSESWQGL